METLPPTLYPPPSSGAPPAFIPGSYPASPPVRGRGPKAGRKPARPRKGQRLGTHMRGQFGELFGQRGSRPAYITVTYSLKAAQDVGLMGRAAFLNYLSCEGDPAIVQVLYKLPAYLAEAGVTAVTITRGHVLQLRVMRSTREAAMKHVPLLERYADQFRELARRAPLAYQTVEVLPLGSPDLVLAHEERLKNWFELIPWVAQARFHPLARAESQFSDMLRTHGALTVAHVAGLAREAQIAFPLLMAAAIRGAALGQWDSDFERVPFGAHSQFSWGAQA